VFALQTMFARPLLNLLTGRMNEGLIGTAKGWTLVYSGFGERLSDLGGNLGKMLGFL
jgi:hypothetical protein